MITEIGGLVRVVTTDLATQALSGGGAGNTLYDATPGDGTWAAAPDAAAPATYQAPFTASTFTVMVQTAAVDVRISSDDGANFGPWIVLPPGIYPLEIDMTDVQVREDVDAGGAEYQIIAFA